MGTEKRELAERDAEYAEDAKALRRNWNEYLDTAKEKDKENQKKME